MSVAVGVGVAVGAGVGNTNGAKKVSVTPLESPETIEALLDEKDILVVSFETKSCETTLALSRLSVPMIPIATVLPAVRSCTNHGDATSESEPFSL